jgi:hypothetical protein
MRNFAVEVDLGNGRAPWQLQRVSQHLGERNIDAFHPLFGSGPDNPTIGKDTFRHGADDLHFRLRRNALVLE